MKKKTVIFVLTVALITPAVHAADVTEADFEKAMKEVRASMQAINKTLRAPDADLAPVAAGAKAVGAALESVQPLWTARKNSSAVTMNGAARTAAAALAKAAESKDAAATGAAVKNLFATCSACHDAHREELPDKTYRIK